MNWSPQQITFLIDDQPFYTYNPVIKDVNTYPFFEDQYLLLNIAMGGIAGPIDPNFTQSSMVIDYVRVYQNTLSITEENTNESDLKVYPNPAVNVVNLESSQVINQVDVFDLSGQLLLSEKEETNVLDISAVKTGIYILKVYSNGIIINRKLVVQ
jgi:beta-glucanase (GH16 family)